ncbi:2859_t:CDS:2 [Cetraspora pellucida]|uniref:2859_t:CDS:1 n=1 Tax=Cetraspora pellucida TaxID=1433469 RepID=A0A9N9ECK8_9GLOM|nr:2859_t:CDS:2 [Cetraspora pellucida]
MQKLNLEKVMGSRDCRDRHCVNKLPFCRSDLETKGVLSCVYDLMLYIFAGLGV